MFSRTQGCCRRVVCDRSESVICRMRPVRPALFFCHNRSDAPADVTHTYGLVAPLVVGRMEGARAAATTTTTTEVLCFGRIPGRPSPPVLPSVVPHQLLLRSTEEALPPLDVTVHLNRRYIPLSFQQVDYPTFLCTAAGRLVVFIIYQDIIYTV